LLIAGQDRAMISEDQMGLVLDQDVGNNNGSSFYFEEVSDRKVEQLHLDESRSMPKINLEDNLDSLRCDEESDIFTQHFGNLSSTHKVSVACKESYVSKKFPYFLDFVCSIKFRI
jgi:hypothetical protein